jgi:hypothetical protein
MSDENKKIKSLTWDQLIIELVMLNMPEEQIIIEVQDRFPEWGLPFIKQLYSLAIESVEELTAIKDGFIVYQKACYDVLHEKFHEVGYLPGQLDTLKQKIRFMEAAKSMQAEIITVDLDKLGRSNLTDEKKERLDKYLNLVLNGQ